MKTFVQTSALLAACESAFPAIASRTTKPVLQCLKISASGQAVVVEATDLEIAISTRAEGAATERDGSICVDAGRLVKLLKRIETPDLFIEVKDETSGQCQIIAGNDRFSLPFEPGENMPIRTDAADGESTWEVDGLSFARMLSRAKYAAGDENGSRFAIGGLYVELAGEDVTMSATDTHMLSVVRGKSVGSDKWSGILPMKAVALAEKIAIGTGKLHASSHGVRFEFGGAVLSTRLLEGRYPPYRDILPKSITTEVPIKVAELVAACHKCRIMATEDHTRAEVHLQPGRLDFSIKTVKGEVSTTIYLPGYEGPEAELYVNPQYVLETAKAADVEYVQFKFVAPNKPVVFDAEDFTGLVMTMSN